MKIYISLPISGHCIDRCRERADKVAEMIKKKGHEAVTPFDACPEPDMPQSHFAGRCVEAVIRSNGILLCSGWSHSPCCALEWECAKIYGKRIFHHVDQIEPKQVSTLKQQTNHE